MRTKRLNWLVIERQRDLSGWLEGQRDLTSCLQIDRETESTGCGRTTRLNGPAMEEREPKWTGSRETET